MKVVLVLLFISSALASFCQVETRSLPIESRQSATQFEETKNIKSLEILAPTREEINELEAEDLRNGLDKNLRFGFSIDKVYDIAKNGAWREEGDFSYYALRISIRGAKALALNFNGFYLPEKTEMYISDANRHVGGNVVLTL